MGLALEMTPNYEDFSCQVCLLSVSIRYGSRRHCGQGEDNCCADGGGGVQASVGVS